MKIRMKVFQVPDSWIDYIFVIIVVPIYIFVCFIAFPTALVDILSRISFLIFVCQLFILRLIDYKKKKSKEGNYIIVSIASIITFGSLMIPWLERSIRIKNDIHFYALIAFYLGLLIEFVGIVIMLISRLLCFKYRENGEEDRFYIQLRNKLIFKYIRFPQVLALILIYCGFCISISSYISSIAFVLFFIATAQFEKEERKYSLKYGDDYLEYMNTTKRIFPYIY